MSSHFNESEAAVALAFFGIFTAVEDEILRKFRFERCQNYCIAPIGMIFMTLTLLKSGSFGQFCMNQFRLSCSTFQELRCTMMDNSSENIYDHAALSVAERTKMKELAEANCQFEYHAYAC